METEIIQNKTSQDYEIRKLNVHDLSALSSLHQNTFAGTLGACLGTGYFKALFLWFLRNPEAIILVCEKDQKIAAYVFGAPDGYATQLNRGLFWTIVRSLFVRPMAIMHPQFKNQIVSRIRSLVGKTSSNSDIQKSHSGSNSSYMYVLVGIGVCPQARHLGVGNELMAAFESVVWEKGYEGVRLSVFPSNTAAISLYEKRGWRLTGPGQVRGALKYILHKTSQ